MKRIISTQILLLITSTLCGQNAFQNLDFELALPDPTQPPGQVSAAAALPSWTPHIGSNQVSSVYFNSPTLDSSGISVMSSNSQFGFPALQGSFSVLLQAGLVLTPTGSDRVPASIEQTGLIPADAKSIQFQAFGGFASAGLTVSLGGQNIDFNAISVSGNVALFAGDVSSFAGQTLELRFLALPSAAQLPPSRWEIDGIEFSNIAIPEPATGALVLIGGAIFGIRGWRERREGLPS